MVTTRLYFTFEHMPTSRERDEDFPSVEVPKNCERPKIVEKIFEKYTKELKGVQQSISQLFFYSKKEAKYLKYEWKYGCGSENNTSMVLKYKKPDAASKKHRPFYS